MIYINVFNAKNQGMLLPQLEFFLFANGQMHYHLSGQRREFQNTASMNLLLFEAAKWAYRNGYKTLHLGGGVGSKNDSLYTFKKSVNRRLDAEFHIGRKIFDEKAYHRLVEIRKQDSMFDQDTTYFPAYRGVEDDRVFINSSTASHNGGKKPSRVVGVNDEYNI